MPAIQILSQFLLRDDIKFSKHESTLLEVELFTRICEELKEIINVENRDYFRLLKINNEKGKFMIETNFIRCIIKDIISTEEYNLSGIACYTGAPEDTIYDVAIGGNNSPSFSLSQKIIDLHRTVRPQLYRSIINKIRNEDASDV